MRHESIRDPCLKSPDPQCYEKNKQKYDPYLGYAPGTLEPTAVGATVGAGAGGAVGSN